MENDVIFWGCFHLSPLTGALMPLGRMRRFGFKNTSYDKISEHFSISKDPNVSQQRKVFTKTGQTHLGYDRLR